MSAPVLHCPRSLSPLGSGDWLACCSENGATTRPFTFSSRCGCILVIQTLGFIATSSNSLHIITQHLLVFVCRILRSPTVLISNSSRWLSGQVRNFLPIVFPVFLNILCRLGFFSSNRGLL